MGLSERKNKQRIGNDPRNLAWRQDSTSFGAQMLARAGHVAGTSLGLSENGLVNPIAAARKIDSSGIGMGRARREGGVEGGGVGSAGGNLDDLLRRLREGESSEGGAAPSTGTALSGFARAAQGTGTVDSVVVTEEPGSTTTTTKVLGRPSRMAYVPLPFPPHLHCSSKLTLFHCPSCSHRNKFRNAKSQASQNNALAMAEILGIPSGSNSPSPSPLPSPSVLTSTSDPADELISKNKDQMSVQDYFKAKMEAKKAAMLASIAAAAGGAPTTIDSSEIAFEEPVVVEKVELAEVVPPIIVAAAAESSSSSEDEDGDEEEEIKPVGKKDKKGKGKAKDSEKELEKAEKKRLKKEVKEAKKATKEAKTAACVCSVPPFSLLPKHRVADALSLSFFVLAAIPTESQAATPALADEPKSKKRSAPDEADASTDKTEKKEKKKSKRRKEEKE